MLRTYQNFWNRPFCQPKLCPCGCRRMTTTLTTPMAATAMKMICKSFPTPATRSTPQLFRFLSRGIHNAQHTPTPPTLNLTYVQIIGFCHIFVFLCVGRCEGTSRLEFYFGFSRRPFKQESCCSWITEESKRRYASFISTPFKDLSLTIDALVRDKRQLEQKEALLLAIKLKNSRTYGVDGVLARLDGACFEILAQKYRQSHASFSSYIYEICPFHNATQKDTSGNFISSLG